MGRQPEKPLLIAGYGVCQAQAGGSLQTGLPERRRVATKRQPDGESGGFCVGSEKLLFGGEKVQNRQMYYFSKAQLLKAKRSERK